MTFSNRPELMRVEGYDFCQKVANMSKADWGGSTTIEAAMDLLLNTALRTRSKQEDLPKHLIIVSDMEFNQCVFDKDNHQSLFETMRDRWASHGYKMPMVTFWNTDARHNNIAMKDDGNVRYVSGFSPVLFEQIMMDKNATDLMMDKLNSERYAVIQ